MRQPSGGHRGNRYIQSEGRICEYTVCVCVFVCVCVCLCVCVCVCVCRLCIGLLTSLKSSNSQSPFFSILLLSFFHSSLCWRIPSVYLSVFPCTFFLLTSTPELVWATCCLPLQHLFGPPIVCHSGTCLGHLLSATPVLVWATCYLPLQHLFGSHVVCHSSTCLGHMLSATPALVWATCLPLSGHARSTNCLFLYNPKYKYIHLFLKLRDLGFCLSSAFFLIISTNQFLCFPLLLISS
jgi:hypothetical protein